MAITLTDIQLFFSANKGDCENLKVSSRYTYANVASQSLPKLNQCLLKLYTPTDKITFTLSANAAQDIFQSTNFNKNLPIVIISHGYTSSSEDANIVQAAKDLNSLGNVNVFTHDHYVLTNENYVLSSTNAQYVGEGLARVLSDLRKLGVSNIHLIGFRLGAQIAGFAGKEFFKLTGSKINRISGLDPASPCFYKLPASKRLTTTDAVFVDVLHTEMHFDGPIGHVDFYPNGGKDQPGCFLSGGCDHGRAMYYAESIKNPNGFLSVQCSNWNTFLNKGCTNNVKAPMGYFLPVTTPPGCYYFKTKSTSPFAMGTAGIM